MIKNFIDISEGIDVNKTSASKQCDFFHYFYFLNYSFTFQPNVCNRCYDLLMISVISDVCKRSDYHSNISLITKNEAMNLKQNAHLTEKSWVFYKEKYQEQF